MGALGALFIALRTVGTAVLPADDPPSAAPRETGEPSGGVDEPPTGDADAPHGPVGVAEWARVATRPLAATRSRALLRRGPRQAEGDRHANDGTPPPTPLRYQTPKTVTDAHHRPCGDSSEYIIHSR